MEKNITDNIRDILRSHDFDTTIKWSKSNPNEQDGYITKIILELSHDEQELLNMHAQYLTTLDINIWNKVVRIFNSIWEPGDFFSDDEKALIMMEQTQSKIYEMIIEDMIISQNKDKSFTVWARDSDWTHDTGGEKDANEAPIRAMEGKWEELWNEAELRILGGRMKKKQPKKKSRHLKKKSLQPKKKKKSLQPKKKKKSLQPKKKKKTKKKKRSSK